MEVKLTYRGRAVTEPEVAFIRALIARHPQASRRQLSKLVCEAWDWVQANGQLRDMVCRSLMLELHRAGLIELPPVRFRPHNNVTAQRAPPGVSIERTPIRCRLGQLQPLELYQVRRSASEALFNALIDSYHYLGYTQPVGEHLKYLVFADGRPVACLAWSSSPRHLGCRDRYIGWSATARRRNVHLLAYNTRFLILPWVEVAHLASHLLARMARTVADDWQRLYQHPVYFLETFVDPQRFRGTCYRAANWVVLGHTTGLGKDARSKTPNRSIKQVLGYPLTPHFRTLLSSAAP
jgi:hypothetical protein